MWRQKTTLGKQLGTEYSFSSERFFYLVVLTIMYTIVKTEIIGKVISLTHSLHVTYTMEKFCFFVISYGFTIIPCDGMSCSQ